MDLDIPTEQLHGMVLLLSMSDPKLMKFSPGSKFFMARYFHTLYARWGLLFLKRTITSECTSKELLLYTLTTISREQMAFLRSVSSLSDHVMCLLIQTGNFFTAALTYKTVVERKRIQAKRTLGLIVKGLWPLSPCSDTIFNICQFYALPFSHTELRVLINGFIGKKGGSIGYRRVVLRRGGKCVI
jgi:hypothetical protein